MNEFKQTKVKWANEIYFFLYYMDDRGAEKEKDNSNESRIDKEMGTVAWNRWGAGIANNIKVRYIALGLERANDR